MAGAFEMAKEQISKVPGSGAATGGFRQAQAWLHTWCGLWFSWLLFAVFLTGSLAVFQEAITHWMTPEHHAEEAAEALGITAHRLKALNLVDKIVNEPVGGAHRDTAQMVSFLKRALGDVWRQLADLKPKELLDRRYERLNSYGRFTDTKLAK